MRLVEAATPGAWSPVSCLVSWTSDWQGGCGVVVGVGSQGTERSELHSRERIGYWVVNTWCVTIRTWKLWRAAIKKRAWTRCIRSLLRERPDSQTCTTAWLSQWNNIRLPDHFSPQTSQAMTKLHDKGTYHVRTSWALIRVPDMCLNAYRACT